MKKVFIVFAFISLLYFSVFAQGQSDASLRRVIEQDKTSGDSAGEIPTLTAAEHLYRADVYSSNRYFPQARGHWQKILDNFPTDPGMPKTLFGIARSFMWERQYEKAVIFFDRVSREYPDTKDGREGLAFKGASYVRLGKNTEAAKTYEQYATMYPTGEKIESSHLNIIDALRELGRYAEASQWVERTRQRFPDTPTETNALHARLRMEIYRQNWSEAVKTADELLQLANFSGSMTGTDEVKFLKGFALEKSGRRAEAMSVYSSIPHSLSSYFSGLASEKLDGGKVQKTGSVSARDYPVLYRTELLQNAKKHKIDPRFLLAIMKQESSFRANAKSPAAARGLLQLVYDTALKYNKKAGYPNLNADDLYKPSVNIAIGSLYIADLKNQFGGLYEAIAASFNGGEDNAARWLNRSKPKDAGIFASEIGFAETKNYVFKVMTNYRIYRELYDENLMRR